MKKIWTVIFAAGLMVSFMACSGGNKEASETTEETKTEEVAPATTAPTKTPEEALVQYEDYVKKYVDVIKKMKAGDTNIISEYSQYSSELQQYQADMARYEIDFTPEQMKRWETSRNKLTEALKSLQEKK